MISGRLRHVLSIERPVTSRGVMGGQTITWTLFATVRGSLDFSNSKTVIAAQQRNSAVIGVATIRHIEGITPDMRITCNNQIYEIERPIDIMGRGKELQIPIMAGVSDG